MKLSITDFRCFHKVEDIEVRPINILVGENSAGKSSFLAATRFLLELFQRNKKASFNKDPFYLGAYEQIAHFRGGRFGRANEFSFKVEGPLNRRLSNRIRKDPDLFGQPPAAAPDSFSVEITFENNRSQPSIRSVTFEAGAYGFEATFGEEFSFIAKIPSAKRLPLADRGLRNTLDPLVYDVSYLDFYLRDFQFLMGRRKEHQELPPSIVQEISTLYELYRVVPRALPQDVYASAPVRSKPERTYNPADESPSPGGEHIPYILAQMKYFDKKRWDEFSRALENFGKASGLFRDLNIKRLSDTQSGPFQIIINLDGIKSNLIDGGYGVGQVLPILTDILRAQTGTLFLFQQPEVHLHPKAQAELASFFAQMVKDRHHTLFIETHSDYLIDRIRTEVRSGQHIKPDDVSILFFQKNRIDTSIHSITIDNKGNLIGAPPNYREFFIREELRTLGLEGI